MPSSKTHHTPNACTPKPRRNHQTSRNWHTSKSYEETLKAMQKADHSRNSSSFLDFKHFVCSTCQKCVFNANHDACIIKSLKEVNSHVKIQPNKTRNSNKPVDPTSHTQKPGRKIVTGHSFSPNKSSAMHEKTNTPRSCLRDNKELLLVQIYVDDIIFAASTPELCDVFAKIMCSKFKMSMMDKISFFLGLQISQSSRGIFINHSKYALESLKKYGFESCNPVDTPMVEKSKLDEVKEGKAVNPSHYRGMIATLLYLTSNANHAGCQDTRRSTSGSMQFLGDRLFHTRSLKQILSLLGKKVEAILKSAWTEKDPIDNFLKERRLMRILEKFIGGRLYEGDLRLLQRTI
nr:hypothetical protein [Tanacetum cinerariifolium]